MNAVTKNRSRSLSRQGSPALRETARDFRSIADLLTTRTLGSNRNGTLSRRRPPNTPHHARDCRIGLCRPSSASIRAVRIIHWRSSGSMVMCTRSGGAALVWVMGRNVAHAWVVSTHRKSWLARSQAARHVRRVLCSRGGAIGTPMKRLLQVFDWFLHAFGLAGLAAMTTLAVIITPNWPIITALLLAPPIITALLLLAPLVVGLLGRIAPLSTPRHR